MVRLAGLEPACPRTKDFKSFEYTISPQSRSYKYIIVFVIVCCEDPCSSCFYLYLKLARLAGIEPTSDALEERCLIH
jgi:hypothetical protein